jgi:leucyl-tRNA synthetase
VYDQHGLPIALPEEMLPVRLPEMTGFRPEPQEDEAGEPVPPLARAEEWATVELDLGDRPRRYRRELNTMPQWAGSCWYYLRYLDPTNDRAFVDPGVERYWMVPPDAARDGDGGVDLYVSPDDMCRRYGADTLRLYEMAMGPLDADRPWRTGDIVGVHRFLQRLWRSLIDEDTGEIRVGGRRPDDDTLRHLHRTIGIVRKDFEGLRFNTAIARLTELTTHAAKVAARDRALPRAVAEPLVLMVAPLAPHVAEELWTRLCHEELLTYAPFPVADEALAAERTVDLPVQVDGRTRFTIGIPAGASEEEIERLPMTHARFAEHTEGVTVRRLVIVPGRIVNIVTR